MAPFDGDVTEFEQVTKPDVFSVEGLRDWLRTQDPAREYNIGDNHSCLLARWLGKEVLIIGYDNPTATRARVYGENPLWREIAAKSPFTFGDALSRCDAYLARTGA